MIFDYLYNDGTINIFCDASMVIYNKSTGKRKRQVSDGCSGAIAMCKDTMLEEQYRIANRSTNNECEIKAIRIGIDLALKYRNQFSFINIFSDSQVSICGIRDWIFTWRNKDNKLYAANAGKLIANQNVFKEIVMMIEENRLLVNLFNQKGHVKINNELSFYHAAEVFYNANQLPEYPDEESVRYISFYNNLVDNRSREIVRANREKYREPLSFSGLDFNAMRNNYKRLINAF